MHCVPCNFCLPSYLGGGDIQWTHLLSFKRVTHLHALIFSFLIVSDQRSHLCRIGRAELTGLFDHLLHETDQTAESRYCSFLFIKNM